MEFNINFHEVIRNISFMAVAYVLAMPIAWDREKSVRSAGLRTFPLVAVASCGFMLIGISVLDSTNAEARVMYGIMTGIGFIGGGAIVKDKGRVSGTATAASIWNTGAIGTAVAWGRFEVALVLSLINFITLWMMRPLKKQTSSSDNSD